VRNALVLIAALAACEGCKNNGGTAQSNEIVIGEYGSMTGSEATFGQSTHNGLMMAVDEINSTGGIGGKRVKLVNYDDQGKTSEVGTAVTRLITEDKALAVIGEVASSLSIAGGQIAQQHQTPMISPSSTNPKVTETGDYVFRVCFIDPFQGYVMARFATDAKDKNGLGVKKLAVLVDNRQAYSQGLAKDFTDALTKMGGTVVANEKYQGGDQDFSAQLTNIKAQNPEAIFIPGYYTDVANVAKQVRAMGISVPLLGGDGWESVTNIGGDAIQGAFYSNHYSADEPRPEVKAFVDKYKTKYNATPDSMAALSHDAMFLLKNAIEKSNMTGDLAAQRKAVRDTIAQTKDFQGVTGKISMDANRNATKPAVVLKIVGKSTTAAASIAPQ
jgi:branched-chain amino acid transport system substrate-binding protein